MDQKILVGFGEGNLAGGWELVSALDNAGFPVRAAWWEYKHEVERWDLVVASSYVEKNGPLKAYQFARSIIDKLKGAQNGAANASPSKFISLDNLSLVNTRDSAVKQLMQYYPQAINRRRKKLTPSSYDFNWLGRTSLYLFPAAQSNAKAA